jgi:hypothetical protein
LRKIRIVEWNHQLLDSTDLTVDELAQLRRAASLSEYDSAQQTNEYEQRCSGARSLHAPQISVDGPRDTNYQ